MGNDLITQACPMSEKRPANHGLDQRVKDRIGQQLRDYYHSCLSEELPARLLTVLKKLDEETEQDSKLR
jgi:hypothetical protein